MERPNRLKELREARQLTLKEVGKLLDKDFTLVHMHETGKRHVTEEDVEAYSKLYKVPSHQLFMELPRESA